MATFDSIFPTFLAKCGDLHTLLLSVAFALFIVGIIVTVMHHSSHKSILHLLLRLLILTSLLVFLPAWGNTLQNLLQTSILSGLGVDPANVYQQFNHLLIIKREAMLKISSITGVEIDPLTARIAKALYPDSDIREQPFEKSKLMDESFDLAISNVPFGDYTVHDPRWNDFKFPIHDYFFAAALDKVRPGGLLMFVTSRHTLDKLDSSLRESLGDRAEFLGAIRLPNTAFKKNAGTEVTTDIVMLRKLRAGESPTGPAWKASVDFTNDQQEKFSINEYFAAHPEMMLGKMRLARGMYRDGEPVLEPDNSELGEALAHAVARLPQNIYAVRNESVKNFDPTIPAPDYIKPNAYCVHEDGRLCLNEDGVLNPLDDLPVETRSRIRRLIDVRDAVRDCLRSQLDGSGEERLIETREKLNHAYDRFVARFGYISVPVNQRAFHGDPDLPLLLSLENYDEETCRAVKASVFRERTIHHKQPVQSVGSPKEALLVSLNEKGRVDLEHMAGLLARPATDFLPDLKGMVFLNPETKRWETEDQYLSGNVREKLVAADSASVADVRFRENVEALKSVQPADLPATEIDVRLGASWLPPSDVQDFVHGLLGVPSGVEVGHIRSLESVVQGFEERAARLESDIKDSQKRATELEAKVGSPFEKEERYHHLARRQSEIEEQLDLTKNQAPSQVDAATTDEREENSEKQTETKSIQQTRRAAVRV